MYGTGGGTMYNRCYKLTKMRRNVGQLFTIIFLLSTVLCCQLLVSASVSSCSTAQQSSLSSSSSCEDIPRGGGSNAGIDNQTRDTILRFLDYTTTTDKDDDNDIFHIQGWRWHFMSLIRDSKRLQRLADHLSANSVKIDDDTNAEDGYKALEEATNYVVNFNMAGLYRIQSNMFLKFIREHLCTADSLRQFSRSRAEEKEEEEVGSTMSDSEETTKAFHKLIDKIDAYRVQSERIGKELVRNCYRMFANHLL